MDELEIVLSGKAIVEGETNIDFTQTGEPILVTINYNNTNTSNMIIIGDEMTISAWILNNDGAIEYVKHSVPYGESGSLQLNVVPETLLNIYSNSSSGHGVNIIYETDFLSTNNDINDI